MDDRQNQAASKRAQARVAALRRRQLSLALAGEIRASARVARRLRRRRDGQWDWTCVAQADGHPQRVADCRPPLFFCHGSLL